MKHVYDDIKELIGQTPIVRINHHEVPDDVTLYAKLEYFNPGGSVKDRLGMALIEAGERSGELKPGGTIIEPTAGNTGIGLALAAVRTGYKVKCIVPEKFSHEKQALMRALGAEVINTPTKDGMKGAIERAKQLTMMEENSYLPLQFQNPANPEVHYRTTGPEIWDQMDGKIDIFVAGAGSGGTFMGAAKYLKEQNPSVKAVIVEPEGGHLSDNPGAPHDTEGIGMEFLPAYMDRSYFDAIHIVSDEEAFHYVRVLSEQEGLLVASSSGAAFVAALREAKLAKAGTNILVVFPDSSERYLSQGVYAERGRK
ncbi:PLP-dependent cysteine synthase family protein [Mechercharimyces sp. CAU 1602]|uniref:PLP-dependent cysteine synthase family protein n=1 Tax=Mechercharimyces sp. CAU 1602 TaxID=2973933 RepID=UPI0021629C24|nr:cysteine synthase family protein [Mechercharimyces sp. CAU 1602]MCS1351771.1 cysteine synthase family protein [Mechercharimyces sp. CAU 1602]